jgi:predicted transcriptional regulator
MNYPRWTASEDKQALMLRSQGLSWNQVAKELGRTKAAVVSRFAPEAFGRPLPSVAPKADILKPSEVASINEYEDMPLSWLSSD